MFCVLTHDVYILYHQQIFPAIASVGCSFNLIKQNLYERQTAERSDIYLRMVFETFSFCTSAVSSMSDCSQVSYITLQSVSLTKSLHVYNTRGALCLSNLFLKRMESFKPLEALLLQGNLYENWRRWVRRFDLYLLASGKIREKEDIYYPILLHAISEEVLEIYNTFEFGVEENGKIDVLRAKFKEYVNPKKNTVFERYKFWEYKQKEGETLNQFITELKTRAKSLEFGDQHNSMICD